MSKSLIFVLMLSSFSFAKAQNLSELYEETRKSNRSGKSFGYYQDEFIAHVSETFPRMIRPALRPDVRIKNIEVQLLDTIPKGSGIPSDIVNKPNFTFYTIVTFQTVRLRNGYEVMPHICRFEAPYLGLQPYNYNRIKPSNVTCFRISKSELN